jgi:hypothetical protein
MEIEKLKKFVDQSILILKDFTENEKINYLYLDCEAGIYLLEIFIKIHSEKKLPKITIYKKNKQEFNFTCDLLGRAKFNYKMPSDLAEKILDKTFCYLKNGKSKMNFS